MPKKPRLLVVDDERDNLDLLYRTFRREFQVFRADSPASAMEILDTEGEMAVIISDQSMPEMTGVEFLGKTKDRFPDTIGILLTGYDHDQLGDEGEEIDFSHVFKCITKPWQPEEFKAVIQEALEKYLAAKPPG